jgi:hypothetical protein
MEFPMLAGGKTETLREMEGREEGMLPFGRE